MSVVYEWLNQSLEDGGVVITANRRLARVLATAYGEQQASDGKLAWQSPQILAWPDWLKHALDSAQSQLALPTRINAQQSQWLWERCLRKELPDKDAGYANLVRLSRDARQRLTDWQIGRQELRQSCQTPDQRLFVSALARYEGVLKAEGWIDDAGHAPLCRQLIEERSISVASRVTLVGFDRVRPVVSSIVDELQSIGSPVQRIDADEPSSTGNLAVFSTQDSEYRAAGAWSRKMLETNPAATIAIVSSGLETHGDQIARWIREGATPGWQNGPLAVKNTVNISYGRKFNAYPPITIALLCLRWCIEDIAAADLSLILRSNCVVSTSLSDRARIETQLRQLPDRSWSPAMLGALFRTDTESNDEEITGRDAWFETIAELSKRRRELPKFATPAEWAVIFDETLGVWRWLDVDSTSSAEFQLVNRWRELLNELARLSLVSSRMSAAKALAQLQALSSDAVFQIESKNPRIHLLGPLEAAGMQFDHLWVCGLTANQWPPPSRAPSLLSRRLQEKYLMPDATPADTAEYAKKILSRLAGSAPVSHFSYSRSVDDAEQSVTELLKPYVDDISESSHVVYADPGWHARQLRKLADKQESTDRVPTLSADEQLLGGAATLQRQLSEPISAFVHGRLGTKPLYPQATGLPPPLRGNLIHDALYHVYLELPDSATIRSWSDSDIGARVAGAVNQAFSRHERHAGNVLRGLLALERERVTRLVRQFITVDAQRSDFKVAGVEGKLVFNYGILSLPLRFDRIDVAADQTLTILDYKTGSPKHLLTRDEQIVDIQLFVYALATQKTVSSLALVNIDSREILLSGAGRGFRAESRWSELLAEAQQQIEVACEAIVAGDVRVARQQGLQRARSLNVLTRYTELQRDRQKCFGRCR